MKKLYLAFLLQLSAIAVFSQTTPFAIITPTGVTPDMIYPGPGVDVTGDTVVFCNTDLDSATIIQGRVWVVNTTGSTISTVVRRFEECMVSGSENYFCWDICWSTGVSVSGPMSITAGDTATYFYGDYKALGNSGASVIRYRFYDDAVQTNYSEVYIKYQASANCLVEEDCFVGIDEEEASITSVYPNPASDFITFEYNTAGEDGTISIFDITGKVVRNMKVNSGSTKSIVDLEGLNSGVYFYTFSVNNKPLSTRKFIIKK